MKVEDFEKAIAKDYPGMDIDEVRMDTSGQVKRCFAHRDIFLFMWNGEGHGFVMPIDESEREIDCNTHDNIPDECYFRSKSFDLSFE